MSDPIVSPNGIIHVLAFTPTEGERGVPITVRIHFLPELADAMFVRLVVGNKAVPTKVSQLPGVEYGRWHLHASAPLMDLVQTTNVLLSVQALNEENTILDSVTFGEFSYWVTGSNSRRRPLPRLTIPDSTIRRRSNLSPTGSENSPFPSSPVRTTRIHRRMKSKSALVRTKRPTSPPDDQQDMYPQTPILDLVTPLASICVGWSNSEISAGRRLVRFNKVQDGRRLIVSCEPILQDDFSETDSVISCIYRKETDTCFVTSVDVIYLLERLTNGEFPVEEKNRIRRNLEGLRPTTVSKHKPGFGDFFQRIMEFPDPKPRNIEKDLKVFEWNLLSQALEKILSKYSIYTSAVPDSPGSSPVDSPVLSQSPELNELQLCYPPEESSSSSGSRFLDQKVDIVKYEPTADSGMGADSDLAFPSPVDSVNTASSSSPSSPTFPVFTSTGHFASAADHPRGPEPSHHPWVHGGVPDIKGEMVLENYLTTTYESEPLVGFANDPSPLDFNIYDSYSFTGIADDSLAQLADQYL